MLLRIALLAVMTMTLSAAEPWHGVLPTGPCKWVDITVPLDDGTTASVRVHHPTTGDGPWPVVVFSHGLGGSREGYGFLGKRWAEHGYVSIHPDHPGSDTAAFRGRPMAELAQFMRQATTDLRVLEGRPRLVAALITALPALERAVPAIAGKIDVKRVGVAGHSYGGWTTMSVAGQKLRLPGEPKDWSDPRPLAFAALSPSGPSSLSKPEDWAGVTRPLLVMTGSDDRQPAALMPPGQERSGAWRRQVFDLVPAGGNKLLAWFDGARHCTFSGGAGARLTGEPEPDPAQVEAVAVVTLAWWDARLRGDAAAQAWLDAADSAAALGPWARFERR